jgi:transcriptional regulator with XRE-family HTH domain
MSLNLSNQLAARVKRYCHDHNISQRKLAKIIGVDEGQFSAFLSGTVNMSAERTLKLLQLMNKVAKPLKEISIVHFQSSGKPMTMDDSGGSWVPGDDDDDVDDDDPAGDGPSDDDILGTLQQVDEFHKQAREAIADYIAQVGQAQIPKARINQGPTEGARRVKTNVTSQASGPHSDEYPA